MPKINNKIDPERFGNAGVIFSFTLLVLLLTLWFTTKNDFWAGIIAFSTGSLLAISYCWYTNYIEKKKISKKRLKI